MNDGSFREDLCYRLAVVELHVPPLRRRRDDVPLLAAAFHERFTGEKLQLSPESLAALAARRWPGNVRELRNFVERSVSLGWGSTASAPHGPSAGAAQGDASSLTVPTHLPLKEARVAWTELFELHYVRAILPAET